MTHPDRPDLVYQPFFRKQTHVGWHGKITHDIEPARGYVVCLGSDGPDLRTRDPWEAARWAWNHARRLGRTITVVLDDRRSLCDFVPPDPGDEVRLPRLTPSAGSLWPATGAAS